MRKLFNKGKTDLTVLQRSLVVIFKLKKNNKKKKKKKKKKIQSLVTIYVGVKARSLRFLLHKVS